MSHKKTTTLNLIMVRNRLLYNLLCEARDLLEQSAEADHNGTHFCPNDEMDLVMRIDELLDIGGV